MSYLYVFYLLYKNEQLSWISKSLLKFLFKENKNSNLNASASSTHATLKKAGNPREALQDFEASVQEFNVKHFYVSF